MNKAKKFMFWSLPIRYISESYSVILLCAAINLYRPDWSSFGLALNSNLSITFVGICILAIPFVWFFFYQKGQGLKEKKVKQMYGSLYSDMHTHFERVQGVQAFTVLYFLRRILLVFSIIFLKNVLSLQVFIFVMMLILQVIVVGIGKPYKFLE